MTLPTKVSIIAWLIKLEFKLPAARRNLESEAVCSNNGQITLCSLQIPDSKIEACLQQARLGFQQNLAPKLTDSGTSGAYIIRNLDGPVAVFKPIDEEPFAPNNPRGMTGLFGSDTCRPSIKSGESTIREVAAYLLDHQGFSGVPTTSLVKLTHKELPMRSITSD